MASLGLLIVQLGCRPPSADLQLSGPDDVAVAEPSGLGGPQVIVEAPVSAAQVDGTMLDWTRVDDEYASLISGNRARVDYDADHPWTGANSPLVTIVVFYDYQCPYSKRLVEGIGSLVAQQHRDDVRVVWRQLPLAMHKQAELAARFALAAHQQGMFAPMHEWLFANASTLDRPSMERAAADLGLDVVRLSADVDSDWVRARVEADVAFAQSLGLSATPTSFINGIPTRGAVSVEKLENSIAQELAVANLLVEAGSDRREVWARILAASQPGVATFAPTVSGPDPNKRYVVDLTGLTARGAKRPKVSILMCGDFDCPYCARSVATLDEVLKRHPKDVAVHFRHMPLDMHPTAMAAHRAAVAAANQGEFWAMFELLYADQKLRTDAELEGLAKQAKLDLKQFRRDVADPATDTTIQRDEDICTKQLDSRGTPSFFINGRPLSGAQPIDAFEQLIADELVAPANP